jgi:hypothetical protein
MTGGEQRRGVEACQTILLRGFTTLLSCAEGVERGEEGGRGEEMKLLGVMRRKGDVETASEVKSGTSDDVEEHARLIFWEGG